MDSDMKAYSVQCHERGTEIDRAGKEASRRFHPWGLGTGQLLERERA